MLTLREHQLEVVQKLNEGFANGHTRQLLYAPTGFGKCLAKGTPVIMFDGTIKPVEDVVVGDLLLSPEGEPRLVDGTVCGVDKMYEVMPTKGDPYIVNSSHILSLRMTGNKSNTLAGDGNFYKPNDIVNISIEDYLKSSKTFKHCAKGWRADPIDFKINAQLPVDPYILGAWLGDGTTKEPAITNIEPEIIDYIYQFAKDINGRVSVWDHGNCKTYRICDGDFLSSMRSIGVIGNKHIPHLYKTASIEARQRLLAGIIDTDGYMFMDNFEITLKVKQLADDVLFLARSLGLAAYITKCTKTIKNTGFYGTYYRITISGETDQIPCLVPRKKAKPRKTKKNVRNVGITVTPLGQNNYYGFSISGNKKLFLLGDFTVTHNTEVAMAIMKAIADTHKKTAMVLDRIVLVNQTSSRLSRYDIEHGVMQSGHWRWRPHERIQVCSAQTLEKRKNNPDIDLLIVDECFVAGTKISTPTGYKDIDIVRCGDLVYNQHGIGIVEAISIKPSDDLYRLEFDDGTITECTKNHPHFTEQGWKTTGELEVGSYFFSEQGMRLLWERVETLDQLWGKRKNNIRYAREDLEYANYLLSILLEEITEPNEQQSKPFENEGKTKRDQAQTYTAWRERAIVTFAATSPITCTWARMGSRDANPYEDAERKRLSDLLQAGLSKSNPDASDRNRWRIAHNIGAKSSGQKENRPTYFPRLVSVSHIKRESPTSVYNLQVSGHPSYFANGKLVHNCHVLRRSTVDFIMENPNIHVIGLTATPFTKGLGDIYTHVVGASPTGELIKKGWLVPLKVFIAKEIDMAGAKKVAGEWSADEVSTRGMKIVGDVVSEWTKKTYEIYGKPAKTIVFCAGVEHGRALEKRFEEAGFNFKSISYKEDDDYKRMTIEDFSKPDTEIHGLIATDILTRGFDVTDVLIGVSARPFSKSFSSHVQQMGRVMRPHDGKEFGVWLCLAKGSRVLTDKGMVAIDKVTLDHKIWDGTNFVNHGGAVCNGIQTVITYQGLTATEGHLVHTQKGWLTFGECARQQIRITQTGLGGTPIRIGENLQSTGFLAGRKAQALCSCFMSVCNLWLQKFNIFVKSSEWKNKRLPCLQSASSKVSNVALQQSTGNEGEMLLSKSQSLPSLWRAWNRVQVWWCQGRHYLDYGKFRIAAIFFCGREIAYSVGQNRSKWTLRTWKPKMDFRRIKSAQQAWQSSSSKNAQIQNRSSRHSLCRQYIEAFVLGWIDGRTNCQEISPTIHETKREVWDILNAGQHNRFTCEGLLVHNCHSGNFLRFRPDWDRVFDFGVEELDGGLTEKAKKEPTEKEKVEAKCPSCGALWIWKSDECGECGHVKKKVAQIQVVDGELQELEFANSQLSINNKEFYAELRYYAMTRGYKDGWAAYKYKEKFGVFPNNLPKNVKPVSPQTLNWIKSRMIAYSKSKQRAVA